MSDQEVARLEEQVKTLFLNMSDLKVNFQNDVCEIKEDVKDIRNNFANRLPNWASILISILTTLLGYFIAT